MEARHRHRRAVRILVDLLGRVRAGGSSLNLFADRLTKNEVLGYSFPSTWYQSLNSMFMIFGMAPLLAWLWVRLGPRQPSSPVKFALGPPIRRTRVFALLVPAAKLSPEQGILVSPWWLVGVYFLHTIGELCLSPVGLSTVTKLAPVRIAGAMMGLWFLSIAVGKQDGRIRGRILSIACPYPSCSAPSRSRHSWRRRFCSC